MFAPKTQRYVLMTWTFKTPKATGVVTAENVDLAIRILASSGYTVQRTDLIPAVTHSRWFRILQRGEEC
jgi:hypothetical protein